MIDVSAVNEVPGALNVIAAMGQNNEIGFKGDMPWHIPEDLRHFKEMTSGHPVIMGRATWMSLPRRPLPGRLNIILTRDNNFVPTDAKDKILTCDDNVIVARSLTEAISSCMGKKDPFIIGGGLLYAESLPLADRLYVTRIDARFSEADTYFPEINPDDWTLTAQSETYMSQSGIPYRFETYERRNNK